jgi:uncharacterized protein GlcG (DUF336 family)
MSMPAAAQVDPRFIVSSDVAAMTGEMNAINFATAEAIAKACMRIAAERGETMAIVITDNLGSLTYAGRMDGNTLTSVMFAQRKAATARLTRAPTHLRQNNVTRDPNATTREIYLGLLPNAGGLPIWAGDQIIGFIGVGGSNARPPEWSDEICAHRALEEVIGGQPPLTQDP